MALKEYDLTKKSISVNGTVISTGGTGIRISYGYPNGKIMKRGINRGGLAGVLIGRDYSVENTTAKVDADVSSTEGNKEFFKALLNSDSITIVVYDANGTDVFTGCHIDNQPELTSDSETTTISFIGMPE